MTPKHAVTSNVRYDEKCIMMLKVHHSERGSAIFDCLVLEFSMNCVNIMTFDWMLLSY